MQYMSTYKESNITGQPTTSDCFLLLNIYNFSFDYIPPVSKQIE